MPDDAERDDAAGAAQVPHFEDTSAPMIYADDCWGGGRMNGDNITLTFAANMLDHTKNPPTNHTKTVLRLVLPRVAAAGMVEFIGRLLTSIDAGSASPPPSNRSLN